MPYALHRIALAAFLCAAVAPTSSRGAETPDADQFGEAIFGFGGVLTDENMGRSANPFGVSYENRITAGVGYQRYFYRPHEVQVGMEVGVAARAIGGVTGEVWGGPVIRYDGFSIANTINISPSFTAGLSAVSGTHRGREQRLEERYEGNAAVLFYLGPELNVSFADTPEVEAFWRLHHRSGANGTLGNMRGAMNANVLGLRLRY